METQVATGIRKHYASIDYRNSDALPTSPIDQDEAIRAVRRLYRWATGRTWDGYDIVITSGNRYTWVRRGVFKVNAGAGWKRLAHDLSHYFWHIVNPGERPHSKAHAKFEAKLIREIRSRGYLDGKLAPKQATEPVSVTVDEAKAEKIAQKIDRLHARKMAWERKANRATNAIKKINRSLAYYERN